MNPLLLDYFEQIVSRAEDVGKLNAVILQLAVQGKLVAQDPADEPASELLKRIAAEKKRLKIKSQPLPEIGEEERPFSLPNGWEWVRLPEIYHSVGQKKPDKTFTYIDVSSIDNVNGRIGDELSVIEANDAPSRARKLVKNGSVIYSTVRPYLLNIAIVDREFDPEPIVSTAFAVMHPFEGVHNRFLYYYLRSKPFIEFVESEMTGMAYPAISDSKLNKGLFPLPPLAEQKRIVERVDTLLAQTRQLETQLAEAEQSLSSLHHAATQELLAASDADEFAATWQFIADNFDTLYDEAYPEAALANVAALKQAILQLAVQGKLTRQDPADEPASALLTRIAAEKERLVKEKKIRKSKPLPEISDEERPFALPAGWEWVRLGELSTSIQTGPFGSALHKADYIQNGIPVINPASIKDEKIVPSPKMMIDEQTRERLGSYILEKDDIVMGRRGEMGRCALVTEVENGWLCGTGSLILRFSDDVYKPFIVKLIGSAQVKHYLMGSSVGATMNNLNHRILNNLIVGLPPLAEQKRIVTRVNTLLHLCDELSAQLQEAQATRTALRDAILRS